MDGVDRDGLYAEFVARRAQVVALTDHFQTLARSDPRRTALWQRMVDDTETTRLLLVRWLTECDSAPSASLTPT